MKIIDTKISIAELKEAAEQVFGDFVKVVVDLERVKMAIGGELHADEEAVLLGNGSKQENLWGINLYPANFGGEDFIEFDSMVNIKPGLGNFSRAIKSEEVRKKIKEAVAKLVG
ncbi:hypothetical protein EPN28_03845 [Patescibacteria group bacterium]|nr:MAG: hypothetical protein EPN28_03845 [Patescibacteria group bacterium]